MEIDLRGSQKLQNPYSQHDAQLKRGSDEFISKLKNLQNHSGWRLKQDKPMTVHEMQVEDRLVARGQLVINLPFQVVFDFLSDPGFIKHLSKDVVQLFEIMYDNKVNRVVHMIMRFPGPVSEREVLAVNTVKVQGDKAYLGNRSCQFPCKLNPDCVLAEVHASGFILQRQGMDRTKVTSISDMDPKGWIPGFIKNAVASKRVQFLLKLEDIIRENRKK